MFNARLDVRALISFFQKKIENIHMLHMTYILSSSWNTWYYLPIKELPAFEKCVPCIDAPSPDVVINFVRRINRADGADKLAERLERVYERFPPRENSLRRLSLFQQMFEKEGGEREFCITIVYVIASMSVSSQKKPKVSRALTI